MSDPNATIGPQQARQASTTRIMRAVEATHARRVAAAEGVSPAALFWLGVVRNFVLGIPFTGLGFIWAYREAQRPVAAVADLMRFVPAALMLVVGVAFLAPGQVESALRFLGLGGIVDRLPFLRGKSA